MPRSKEKDLEALKLLMEFQTDPDATIVVASGHLTKKTGDMKVSLSVTSEMPVEIIGIVQGLLKTLIDAGLEDDTSRETWDIIFTPILQIVEMIDKIAKQSFGTN